MSELSWSFLKIQMFSYCFFLQSSRYVSNQQPCLKTTGLYGDLLLLSSYFHLFYLIFSTPISFSLHSPISASLLFFDVLSQAFIKYSRKKFSLHMYKYVQYLYFRKLMNSCLTKKIMTSWFHLFDLIWRDF